MNRHGTSEDGSGQVRLRAKETQDLDQSENTKQITGSEIGDKFPVDVVDAKCQLKRRVDEASSTVTYVGLAEVGTATSAAAWQIKRLNQNGQVLETDFADGNLNFDNIWNNRAALSYS